MRKIYDYMSSNPVLVNLIFILIVVVGIASFTGLKKEVFPATETDTMIVNVTYQGASPIDIETNVVIPLEDQIKKIYGIKDFVSISLENNAKLYIYLQDKLTDPKSVKDEIIRELTNAPDLPDDIDNINIINANPKRMSVYTFGLTIKDESKTNIRELYEFYDKLEKKLKKVPGVSEIRVSGYLDPEIKIKVNPLKVREYNLSLNTIVDSIKSRNIRSTGGNIQSMVKDQNIVTIGQFANPLDVKDVIIRSNYEGKRILVKDIATVTMGLKEGNTEILINQKKGITVSIVKNENADISETIESVKDFLETNRGQIDEKFILETVDDRSLSITALLNVVVSNALMGFLLVFIILLFFLNLKSAFWTAMGIPTAILLTSIYMFLNDISLNIITMGAIITVLGMLVDDAIVISENIHHYRMSGLSNLEAGYIGLREVAGPVIVSIATTIVAFLPLLAIGGKMGLFIKVFPVIISVALIGSLIESVFLLPHHIAHGKPPKRASEKKWFIGLSKLYKKSLLFILKFRYITLAFFLIIISITFLLSIRVFDKFVLIKDDSSDTILVNYEAPIGTPLSKTKQMTLNYEQKLLKMLNQSNILSVNTTIGNHKIKSINDRGDFENWSQTAIYLNPSSERKETVTDIMKTMNQFVKKNGKGEFEKIFFVKKVIGPDPGMGVDIKVAGNKIESLNKVVEILEKSLGEIKGVSNIDTTNKPGKEEINIEFNYDKMAQLSLDVSMVAQTIKTAYDGNVVTTFQTADKKIDYRLEIAPDFKRDVAFLKELQIPNKQGRLIQLNEIAKFKTKQGFNTIDHYNGDKAVSLTASVNNSIITPKDVMKIIKTEFKKISGEYKGVYLVGGGEAVETEQSLRDLMMAFLLAIFAIYTILVILFKNPIQPLLVLSVIPFGIVGAILAFFVPGIPLSFMGLIGLIGLSGVVVNDSVVMVEFINKTIKTNPSADKQTIKLLVAEGAKRRLRAVLLTTLTTVGGLMPTVYGIGGKAESIVPTVMAMAYGIMFATILTLYFLPSLYMIMVDLTGLLNFKKAGKANV